MYEMIYHSVAQPELRPEDLKNILQEARAFNASNGITGCLLFYKNEFAQLLEGDHKVLGALLNRIERDPRHSHISVMKEAPIDRRLFSNWYMAFHELDLNDITRFKAHLSIDEFVTLLELMEKQTPAKELFYFLSKNMVER